MGAAEIKELLQLYGGWGVAALSIMANIIFVRYIKRQHEERLKEKGEQNEVMLELIEKRVETDANHTLAFRSLKSVIEKLIAKL